MSLRLRLLAAAGAVALVALLAADVATYSALRSFLLDRIDQSLVTAHYGVERRLALTSGIAASNVGVTAPGTYVALRDPQGNLIGSVAAGRFGSDGATPRLPARISGFKAQSGSTQEPSVSFTADATTPGGPQFRVMAWQLSDGGQLILA